MQVERCYLLCSKGKPLHMKLYGCTTSVVFKPRPIHGGYCSRFVYVCMSVCYRAISYIQYLVYMSKMRRYMVFVKDSYCVNFAGKVLFGRYGIICLP